MFGFSIISAFPHFNFHLVYIAAVIYEVFSTVVKKEKHEGVQRVREGGFRFQMRLFGKRTIASTLCISGLEVYVQTPLLHLFTRIVG